MKNVFVCLSLIAATACAAQESVANYGASGKIWTLAEIDSVPFAASATLEFDKTGWVRGQAPCNRYSTRQKAPYPWFQVGPNMATKMACPEMDAENTFFRALGEMSQSEVSGETLLLSNDAGRVMLFKAQTDGD